MVRYLLTANIQSTCIGEKSLPVSLECKTTGLGTVLDLSYQKRVVLVSKRIFKELFKTIDQWCA
jgi:hypothetical protein